ncbi:MAG: hypothetical protein WD276_09335 [Actinomycetota bacterium]
MGEKSTLAASMLIALSVISLSACRAISFPPSDQKQAQSSSPSVTTPAEPGRTPNSGHESKSAVPDWLPPREKVDPADLEAYDSYMGARVAYSQLRARVASLDRRHKQLNREGKATLKQYKRGQVPYRATIQATERTQDAYDRYWEAYGELDRLLFRLNQAAARVDNALSDT